MDEGDENISSPRATDSDSRLSTTCESRRRRRSSASEALGGAPPDRATDLTGAEDDGTPDASTGLSLILLSYLEKNGKYYRGSGQRQRSSWRFFCPTDHTQSLDKTRAANALTCMLCYVKFRNELHPLFPSEGACALTEE